MKFYMRDGKFIFELDCDLSKPKVTKEGTKLRVEVPTESMTRQEQRLLYFLMTYWEERFFERLDKVLQYAKALRSDVKAIKQKIGA